MSASSFNFALLRITVIQILRSIGFDRCSPSLIDILTDLYIRHLQLLGTETLMLAHADGEQDVRIQDVTQALLNIGMMKPSNILDVYEESDDSNKGAESFLLWVVGSAPENARTVSKPTPEMIDNNKLKANPIIPEYINALNSNESGRQESSQLDASIVSGDIAKNEVQESLLEEDWLKFLMLKQSKIGHEDRFKNTLLNTTSLNSHSDHIVAGPTPNYLEEKLPYHRFANSNEQEAGDKDIDLTSQR